MESYNRKLETDGFAIVENVIGDQIIGELALALESLHSQNGVSLRDGRIFGVRDLLNVAPSVKSLANSCDIRKIVEAIAGREARVVRGIFFDKTPEANWKVTWHQDLTIAVQRRKEVAGFACWTLKAGVHHVQPPASILENILTMRIHLDETDESNGALRIIPASHRSGRLDAARIRELKEAGDAITCRVSKGGVLLMRPLLLHASSVGSNAAHRRVVHLEFSASELPAGLEWYGS